MELDGNRHVVEPGHLTAPAGWRESEERGEALGRDVVALEVLGRRGGADLLQAKRDPRHDDPEPEGCEDLLVLGMLDRHAGDRSVAAHRLLGAREAFEPGK